MNSQLTNHLVLRVDESIAADVSDRIAKGKQALAAADFSGALEHFHAACGQYMMVMSRLPSSSLQVIGFIPLISVLLV